MRSARPTRQARAASTEPQARLGLRAIWFIGILCCACSPPRVSLRATEHTFTASDYPDVLRRWTRHADEFDFGRLGEILHVSATFESREFRWAYVVRYAADHSMTTSERSRLLERSLADAETRHRFFVTLGAPIYREGDLTGDQSDWRVLLVDESGQQTEPVEILRIPRPSHDLRAYFPSIHRQRHVFRIAFPVRRADGEPSINPRSRRVTLRFAGAAGTVDLHWDLDGNAG